MGMRRAIIDVSGNSIQNCTIVLFRCRHLEYKREEISAARILEKGLDIGTSASRERS
jgi:hypothetical protein